MKRNLGEYTKSARHGLFNSHIFPRRRKSRIIRKFLKVTQGAVEFKAVYETVTTVKTLKGVEFRARYNSETRSTANTRRGKIVSFTPQSSKRMMIRVLNLKHPPEFWQTFTFADSVLEGLSTEEISRFTSKVIKDFKRKAELRYPQLSGLWRREWEPRKSGLLRGINVPHLHAMLNNRGETEETFNAIALELAVLWVQCTGTSDPNAYAVACHPDSYEYLESADKAVLYIGKYMAKVQDAVEENQSLGRMWGEIGQVEYLPAIEKEYSEPQGVILKRILKRIARSKARMRRKKRPGQGKRIKRLCRKIDAGNIWLIVKKPTMLRIFDLIEEMNVVPF